MKKILFIAILALATSGFAADFNLIEASNKGEAVVVSDVVVSGNTRVNAATIREFAGIQIGKPATRNQLDRAVNNVYDSNLFSNVSINIIGNVVKIAVKENPVISDIKFEGNKKIDSDKLLKELSIKPRDTYNEADVKDAEGRLLAIYKKSGKSNATVSSKTIDKPDNRIEVVFVVSEGISTLVGKIDFVGNQVYTDAKLRGEITTQESAWYKFFTSNDTFDKDRISYDKEQLKKFYAQKGYADFEVVDNKTNLNKEQNQYEITYIVSEGAKYTVAKTNITSKIADVNISRLKNLAELKAGDVYNADKASKTSEAISRELGDLGFAFTSIDTQLDKNKAAKTLDINYQIAEGPRVYVSKINITGNVRTLDRVVRRELLIAEGDPFNISKIKDSEKNINRLSYFDKVNMRPERIEGSADKVALNIDVKEKSTGSLTFGAGFSSSDGVLGEISLAERNFLGKGQAVRLNTRLSSVGSQFDLSFTEPYMFGKPISGGFDAFYLTNNKSSYRSNRTYDSSTVGGAIRTGYDLTKDLTHNLKYTYKIDEINNVDSNAALLIKLQAGQTTTSMISNSFIFDTRDTVIMPSDGIIAQLSTDYAGIGGDVNFIRNELRASIYEPIYGDDVVLKLSANGGIINGLKGDNVRINNRYFLGGNSLRGFRRDGLGPRDVATKDSLGGTKYYSTSAEVLFPLGDWAKEAGFRGAIFADAGSLLDASENSAVAPQGIYDVHSVRASTGLGLAWSSPMGPIRIDYAIPLAKEDFDETERVRFSFGTNF
jgi:outer membrane protein insertion porin family